METMIYAWALSLGIPLVLFFAFSLIFGKRAKPGFSMLTEFPFEMFEAKASIGKVCLYGACAFDALAAMFPLVSNELHPQLLAFEIIFLVTMILKDVALAAIVSIPAYEFKTHIFAFTSFGAMQVLSCAMAVILFANLMGGNGPLGIAFAIILALIGVASAGFLVNPRLAHWTDLQSKVEDDGTITTSRPKPFVLAFTEWMLLFFSFAAGISALVGFAIISFSFI